MRITEQLTVLLIFRARFVYCITIIVKMQIMVQKSLGRFDS